MERDALIERFYDSCEFPHCARNVYCNVYYGLASAMKMECEDFQILFPNLHNPIHNRYEFNHENYINLSAKILETCRLDVLEGIVEYIEYYANLEYDDGYDSY